MTAPTLPAALDALRAGLAAPPTPGLMGDRAPAGLLSRAAVLALLWRDPSASWTDQDNLAGLNVVAIEKTGHLRRHAGQVAFPGGRMEGAETPVAAALREASEEVGVRPAKVHVLGELPPASVMASGFDVNTVVGWWTHPEPLRPVDTGEVEAVHQLSIAELVDPANRATWVHPSGHSGPVFLVDDLFVWGLTGHLLSIVLDLAGWSRPWDAARRLEIPERFLRGRH